MANDGQRVSFHFRNPQINLMLRLKAEKRLLHGQGREATSQLPELWDAQILK